MRAGRMRKIVLVLAALLIPTMLALIPVISHAYAQTGSGYDLTWSTIDNGGGESNGSGYTLAGTIGQPDAGTLSGGGYTLAGGFWATPLGQYTIYLPLVLK